MIGCCSGVSGRIICHGGKACTGAAVVSWLPIKDKTGRPGLHFEVHVAVIYDVAVGLTPQQCQGEPSIHGPLVGQGLSDTK